MSQHGVVYTRLMNSAEWYRVVRPRKLYKDPYCEVCRSHGLIREATVVHHIVEVETGRTEEEQRSLAYAESNLQSLCTRCHSKIHQERRSHSKKVHKERSESRLQAWLSEQMGQSVADKEKSPQNEEKPPP